jgi:hypothetical protein
MEHWRVFQTAPRMVHHSDTQMVHRSAQPTAAKMGWLRGQDWVHHWAVQRDPHSERTTETQRDSYLDPHLAVHWDKNWARRMDPRKDEHSV